MRSAGLLALSALALAACSTAAQPAAHDRSVGLAPLWLRSDLPGAPLAGASANPATDRCFVAWKTFAIGSMSGPQHESAWLIDAPASMWIAGDSIDSGVAGVSIFAMVDTTNGMPEAQEVAVPVTSGKFNLSTQTLAQGGVVDVNVAVNMDLLHFDLDPNGNGTYGVTSTIVGNGGSGSFSGSWSYSQYAEPHLYGGTGSGFLAADFGGNSVTFGTTESIAACYTPL